MELFLASAFIIFVYVVMTFVNVWCLATMLFLAFDKAWLQHYENTYLERALEERRKQLKLIKGGKDDSKN